MTHPMTADEKIIADKIKSNLKAINKYAESNPDFATAVRDHTYGLLEALNLLATVDLPEGAISYYNEYHIETSDNEFFLCTMKPDKRSRYKSIIKRV